VSAKFIQRCTKWELAEPRPEMALQLAKTLQVSPVLGQLLLNRGYGDPDSARAFLNCRLRDLADPFLLPGMQTAAERALQAIEQDETVTLYGDYDVDGVTSVAMLKRILNALGCTKVQPFLPDRLDEGYGLTPAGVDRCLAMGKPRLLIVLDCGTNSAAEISRLQGDGIDVVVLDHHEPSTPANPLAMINYKIGVTAQVLIDKKICGTAAPGCDLPLDTAGGGCATYETVGIPEQLQVGNPKPDRSREVTEYCTAGLVFKFCHALLKLCRPSTSLRAGSRSSTPAAGAIDLKTYLDVVALATVADIAPLIGENRILARHGLRQMGASHSAGLRALMRVSGVGHEPTTYDCGYKLGPRLNAAGRLESAMAALQLLLSDDGKECDQIAQQLDATNRERQAEEMRVLVEARADAEAQLQDQQACVLVVARPGWHEGVVGIVASRIAREFHRPVFVVALNRDGVGKGSGRSIEGFNLAVALEATRSFLLRGGGHAMAAGVSLKEDQIHPWRVALQSHARLEQGLDEQRLKRVVRVDAEVTLSEANLVLMDELQKLEPCGMGNPRPVFLVRKAEVATDPKVVGSDGRHLKLWLRQGTTTMDAIAFGKGAMASSLIGKGTRLNVVFELEHNDYQGVKKIQMKIQEIAVAGC